MKLLRVRSVDEEVFVKAPEAAMDLHVAQAAEVFHLVVGCRVAIPLNADTFRDPRVGYLEQSWLGTLDEKQAREQAFRKWLGALEDAPSLRVASADDALQALWQSIGPVTPTGPLPPSPARPASIYGHLPFKTKTLAATLIYRWEAFPTSLRIIRSASPPKILKDTYAAPASEVFFAQTGFAAVARFALPNLLPATFRYELQPDAGTDLECGASVPLYGQSGGGVEVKFVRNTKNRCPIADPVLLPAL